MGGQRQRLHPLVDVDGLEELDKHQVTILGGRVIARVADDLGREPPLLGDARILGAPAPQPHVDEARAKGWMNPSRQTHHGWRGCGGPKDPHKTGAGAELRSQKMVTKVEEAKAEKGRDKVIQSHKKGRVKVI